MVFMNERLTFCLIRSDRLKHKIVDLSCDTLRKNTDNFPKYLIEHCVQGKRVEAEPGQEAPLGSGCVADCKFCWSGTQIICWLHS